MKIKFSYFILILFLASCCPKYPDIIKDVKDLSQDHTAYLTESVKEKFILTKEDQVKVNEEYDKIYFRSGIIFSLFTRHLKKYL